MSTTPRLRWLVRQEMQFDEHGEAIGHAEVKVLQYATEHTEKHCASACFTVWRLEWHDIPTVHDD